MKNKEKVKVGDIIVNKENKNWGEFKVFKISTGLGIGRKGGGRAERILSDQELHRWEIVQ